MSKFGDIYEYPGMAPYVVMLISEGDEKPVVFWLTPGHPPYEVIDWWKQADWFRSWKVVSPVADLEDR